MALFNRTTKAETPTPQAAVIEEQPTEPAAPQAPIFHVGDFQFSSHPAVSTLFLTSEAVDAVGTSQIFDSQGRRQLIIDKWYLAGDIYRIVLLAVEGD